MMTNKIDVNRFSSDLYLGDNGIWVTDTMRSVSYPEDGNEYCFTIEDKSFWFRHRNNVITQLVNKYSPSSCFVDIGGGNGCVSHALQSVGVETMLLEPGPRGAINAKRRGINTVIQSTLEDVGFMSNSIQAAGVFDVVEHIERDEDFISSIGGYMQKGGVLYVTVPAYKTLWSHEDVEAGHFRRYTIKSLGCLLSKNGYEVVYSSYLFSFLVLPIFLARSVPSFLGMKKAVSQETMERDHSCRSRLAVGIVDFLLDREVRRIKEGKSIPLGSSCIAVARKKT